MSKSASSTIRWKPEPLTTFTRRKSGEVEKRTISLILKELSEINEDIKRVEEEIEYEKKREEEANNQVCVAQHKKEIAVASRSMWDSKTFIEKMQQADSSLKTAKGDKRKAKFRLIRLYWKIDELGKEKAALVKEKNDEKNNENLNEEPTSGKLRRAKSVGELPILSALGSTVVDKQPVSVQTPSYFLPTSAPRSFAQDDLYTTVNMVNVSGKVVNKMTTKNDIPKEATEQCYEILAIRPKNTANLYTPRDTSGWSTINGVAAAPPHIMVMMPPTQHEPKQLPPVFLPTQGAELNGRGYQIQETFRAQLKPIQENIERVIDSVLDSSRKCCDVVGEVITWLIICLCSDL